MKYDRVDELKSSSSIIDASKTPLFGDDRGDFMAINFEQGAKRAYLIKNHHKGIIRAFHGHKKESKFFYVLKGAFKIILIDMETGKWKPFAITEKGNNMLKVPVSFYNGFVSLTDDSILLVISDSTFEDSKNDDYRISYDVLGKEVWEVEHR